MNILSSFTHPHVVPNLCVFLSYIEHKRVLKNGNQTVDDLYWLYFYFTF